MRTDWKHTLTTTCTTQYTQYSDMLSVYPCMYTHVTTDQAAETVGNGRKQHIFCIYTRR